ncbi:phage major tail protein, TP901-1 family [Cytobacillus oceanisediminis]|uniref:phage major tail protein, TP901-1 family n=1 Tax=Cytobacillus oceanisediminis TaxID=665099 RepID=UPI00207A7F91|nr:phage major tail protein, TP901-1 family [Cytobacillus oceanisediminis]MBY0157271.1 phage major tail protein, TP901-1 family [Cytobacillus firmus]USK44649.1 phage major tail protein, TP901-1 family [Cytobacillus oceanisediminis]USK46277.1 phage major tail protein, TP901-1 family [Cytobacillus oceanisediminis]
MQQGKDSILLVQSTDAALGTDGLLIGNLTENTYSIENDIIDESTKFGRIVGYGQNSESFEFTAYGETGDPGQKAVLNAIKNKKQIKVWEVDLNLNEAGKHPTVFGYCIVESAEKSSPQDGFVEVSATVQVIGSTQEGEIDPLPAEMIEFARYGFEAPGTSTGEFPEQTQGTTGV